MAEKMRDWFDFEAGFKVLIVVAFIAFFLLFFVFNFEAQRVSIIKGNQGLYIEKLECLAVNHWISAKSNLLRSQGKALSIDYGTVDSPDYDANSEGQFLRSAIFSNAELRQTLVTEMFYYLYNERDASLQETLFGRDFEEKEENLQKLSSKGIEPMLLENLPSENSGKVLFLSKYIDFLALANTVIEEELSAEQVNPQRILFLADLYDVDFSQEPLTNCNAFLFEKEIDYKTELLGMSVNKG